MTQEAAMDSSQMQGLVDACVRVPRRIDQPGEHLLDTAAVADQLS